jgi:lipopolysaccharide biosynthesis glycosyltransferase
MDNYNVVYATDLNGDKILSVSIFSLIRAMDPVKLRIHIITDSLIDLAYSKKVLEDMGVHYEVHQVDKGLFQKIRPSGHLPVAAVFRLYIPWLIKEPLCLYLDIDTVIISDISNLFNLELNNYMVAGVETHVGYLNSGVLVMNLELIRKTFSFWQFLEVLELVQKIEKTERVGLWMDQTVINVVFSGKQLSIEKKFNTIPGTLIQMKFKDKAAIIHYAGNTKPWKDYRLNVNRPWNDIYYLLYGDNPYFSLKDRFKHVIRDFKRLTYILLSKLVKKIIS